MVDSTLKFQTQNYKIDVSFFTELYTLKLRSFKKGTKKVPINALMYLDGTLRLDEFSFEEDACRFTRCRLESIDVKHRYHIEQNIQLNKVPEPEDAMGCCCKFVDGTLVIVETLDELRKLDKKQVIRTHFGLESLVDKSGCPRSHIFKNLEGNGKTELYKLNHFFIFCYVDVKNLSCYYYIANPVISASTKFTCIDHWLIDNYTFTKDYNNFKLTDLNAIQLHFRSHVLDDFFFVYSRFHSKVYKLSELTFLEGKAYIEKHETPLEALYFCSYTSLSRGHTLPWVWRNFLVHFFWHNGIFGKSFNVLLINTWYFEVESTTEIAVLYSVQAPWKEGYANLSILHGFRFHRNGETRVFEQYYSFMEGAESKEIVKIMEDVNLQMMTWRILPELQLVKITDLKVCVVGLGTLGCSIIRQLLAWGVEKFVLVDRAKVTNATRQCLYLNEDCYSGLAKVDAAKNMMVQIRPDLKLTLIQMEIPMMGHRYHKDDLKELIVNTRSIVDSCDVLILATDSKESRWLPAMLAAQGNMNGRSPLVISAGLGFDSCMIIRHAYKDFKGACYFCSDSEPLRDTITGRPYDETCTIVKPGITSICGSMVVELIISLTQHPSQFQAAHDDETCIGKTPHSIRFSLSDYTCSELYGEPSEYCICCSENVLKRLEGDREIIQVYENPELLVKYSGMESMVEKCEEYEVKEETKEGFVVV